MKVAFLCCVLLLAGSASCSPVEAKSISLADSNIPQWILDSVDGLSLPDAIQNIIDRLPEIIAAIPDIIDRLPEIILEIVNKIPEVIPIIIDKLPEIIAQIPAIAERIREIIEIIIDRIPELIPIILEKIPEIIEAIPAIVDRIKEILAGIDLPDWFPTLPDFDKPDWWPEFPEVPEHNLPTPGTRTTIQENPGIVQIEIGTGSIWVQGCAGSVLTSFHVLSSARCFSGLGYADRFRRVLAGSSTRFGDGLVVGVERVTIHPSYTPRSTDGDICVVRLASNLILGANIQQTAIVAQNFVLPVGFSVRVVGWGSSAQGKLIADRDLYQIDLNTVDEASCANRWRLVPFFSITENSICVADLSFGGRNGDIRDVGAPVLFQNILVSILSAGVPIGNQYFPLATTAVAPYSNWIVANAN